MEKPACINIDMTPSHLKKDNNRDKDDVVHTNSNYKSR